MKTDNYTHISDEFTANNISDQEQLLLNEEDYTNRKNLSLLGTNHYNLALGGLEEDLDEDFESEYDENDWEEEESESDRTEYPRIEEEPETFLM